MGNQPLPGTVLIQLLFQAQSGPIEPSLLAFGWV